MATSSASRYGFGVFSLLWTPVVLFLSNSTALYLSNQDDFAYQTSVLLPFLIAAGSVFSMGVAAYLLAPRSATARWVLWVYYLCGPFYLAYWLALRTWPGLANAGGFLVAVALAFLAAVLLCFEHVDLRALRPLFSFVGVALTLMVGGEFLVKVESGIEYASPLELLGYPDEQSSSSAGPAPLDRPKRSPNVYHMVLDQYSGDLFPLLALSETESGALDGFVYFPNAVAQWGKTHLSIPSIFQGQVHDRSRSYKEWWSGSYRSEQSFLSALDRAGYRNFALVGLVFPRGQKYLHHHA
ncbi:MAG: hypothetical protein JRG96_07215, partial [Deltaproteobacteria bacterium]|nr:hypothetical protein [Deltaproteobacteria bacterium]